MTKKQLIEFIQMEIVERSSGFWVTGGITGPEGPFDTVEKAQEWIDDRKKIKTVKVIVAALNANGEPDFWFCVIRCNAEQYDNGEHYVLAETKAIAEGYEPRLSFDENDTAGKAILNKFVWKSATTYAV